MFCNTISFETELLSNRRGEWADLDQFVFLHRRTASYKPQFKSRLDREHREIGNLFKANDIKPLEAVLLLNDE